MEQLTEQEAKDFHEDYCKLLDNFHKIASNKRYSFPLFMQMLRDSYLTFVISNIGDPQQAKYHFITNISDNYDHISLQIKKDKEKNEMPLVKSKSKKAREKNIKTEIESGKDPKQAVAIGYSVQREAAKKARKKK